jgi:hypothetical protein
MDTRKLETTVEKAELRELSSEEMGAVGGGACDANYLQSALLRTILGQGPGPLESTWISMGCK